MKKHTKLIDVLNEINSNGEYIVDFNNDIINDIEKDLLLYSKKSSTLNYIFSVLTALFFISILVLSFPFIKQLFDEFSIKHLPLISKNMWDKYHVYLASISGASFLYIIFMPFQPIISFGIRKYKISFFIYIGLVFKKKGFKFNVIVRKYIAKKIRRIRLFQKSKLLYLGITIDKNNPYFIALVSITAYLLLLLFSNFIIIKFPDYISFQQIHILLLLFLCSSIYISGAFLIAMLILFPLAKHFRQFEFSDKYRIEIIMQILVIIRFIKTNNDFELAKFANKSSILK